MKASLKTGLLGPLGAQAYERSQILSRVQDDLNVFRVAQEQRRAQRGRRSKMRMLRCAICMAAGLRMVMREWMLEKHLLNHRILRALGDEADWIQRLRANNERHMRKLQVSSAVGRALSIVTRKKKACNLAEWLWQRTILKMGVTQRRRLAWITLRTASPIWLVPVSALVIGHAIHYPDALASAWDVCRSIGSRLISEESVVLLSGWLSHDDAAHIRNTCSIDKVTEKMIQYGPDDPLRFIVWTKENP